MSQPSSRTIDPSWVSVPFAKFSHNSSPYGTRNFTWSHVGSRNDLDFILRNTRVVDENGDFHTRILMKVNAGAEELELQDLGELVQHVRSFDPSSGCENPVQIVIKSPFLAMRYPKSANIVRRIQLKFHNDADFANVFNFVKDIGLPITATTPAPPSISRPPSISPSPSLLSAMSSSTTLTVPSVFSEPSISASSPRISLPIPGSSLRAERTDTPSFARKPLPVPEFKVPMRPNSSFSKPSDFPYAAPQIPRPSTSSAFSSSLPMSALTGLELSHKYMNQPTSVYISQMERELQSRRPSLPILPNLKSSQELPCPILPLYQSQMSSQNHSALSSSQYSDQQLSQSPFFAPRTHPPDLVGSLSREPEASNQNLGSNSSDTLDPQRIAAAIFKSDESTRLTIPPRRELPFPKIREVRPRSASIPELPPLPKPTSISRLASANLTTTEKVPTPAPKPTKKRVAQRKSTAVKAPEIAESPPPDTAPKAYAVTSPALPEDEPSPLAAKSAAVALGPASAASALQSKAATAPKKRAASVRPSSATKRPKMVDQSTQTKLLSNPDRPSALQSFQNEDIPTPTAPHEPAPTPAPTNPPESYLDAVDAFVTRHKARLPTQELWDQPGWAEGDVEQRQLLLNNFICDNLENKDFLKLCEDMAVSWRCIGLGI